MNGSQVFKYENLYLFLFHIYIHNLFTFFFVSFFLLFLSISQHQKGKDIQVLQLHGSNDMTCPYQASSWLRDLMSASMNVTYHTHGGAHDMGTC